MNLIRIASLTFITLLNFGCQNKVEFQGTLSATTPTTPIVRINSKPADYIKTTSATFKFAKTSLSTPIVSFQCKLDAGAFAACTSPKVYSGLTETSHSFFVKGTDATGKVSAEVAATFIVDLTKPILTLSGTPAVSTNEVSATFSFSATDLNGIKKFQCSLDKAAFTDCLNPQIYPVLGTGAHNFRVRAYDMANNISLVKSFNWTILGPLPEVQLVSTPADYVNTTSAQFAFTGSSALSTIAGFECQFALTSATPPAFAACTSPSSNALSAEGAYKFSVRAKDAQGQYSLAASKEFTADFTKPTVSISAKPTSPTSQTSASFTFSGADGLAGIASYECALDQAAFTSCASPLNLTALPVGNRTFKVRSLDRAGNVSDPVTHTWTILGPIPVAQILTFPNPLTNAPTVTFTFSGTSAASTITGYECQFALASATPPAFAACTSPKAYTMVTDGVYKFSVRALDAQGQYSTAVEKQFTSDQTKPIVTITAQPSSPTAQSTASFEFNATDSLAGIEKIECALDQAAFATCTSPQNLSSLPAGARVFKVRAVDKAGNVSNEVSHNWTIDIALPTVQIVNKPANPTTETTANFTFTGTAPSGQTLGQFQCQLDSGAYETCASPKSYANLTVGSHTFSVKVTSSSGAVSVPAPYTWTINTTQQTGQTLFTTQVPEPQTDGYTDNVNYELGMKFTADVEGNITAIRFYKGVLEGSAAHVGKIYSASGQVLATVNFTNETASGWQQQTLATPLAIAANTVYVVSVNTGNMYYVTTVEGFASEIVNQNLHSVVGENGVFGPVGAMPTQSWNNSNYFRDIVFVATGTPPPPPPTGKVDLAWDPVQSTANNTLAGYRIYWGPSSGNYTDSKDVGNLTTTSVTGLVQGQAYYFAVTAYDTNQVQSGYSNEVNTTLAPAVSGKLTTLKSLPKGTSEAKIIAK